MGALLSLPLLAVPSVGTVSLLWIILASLLTASSSSHAVLRAVERQRALLSAALVASSIAGMSVNFITLAPI